MIQEQFLAIDAPDNKLHVFRNIRRCRLGILLPVTIVHLPLTVELLQDAKLLVHNGC